ncbi:MAG: serine/threonine-protein kinase [Atopobiaceae bacterium]
MARPGDILDGRYRLESLLGQGGMSRVWLARDLRLDVVWAAKQVDVADDPDGTFRQALLGEARILRELEHPALPRVVDVLQDGSSVYLVMDLVRGTTLAALVRERGRPLDAPDACSIATQLCDVLGYLHERTPPVVHRDVKPSNVVVQRTGRAKLIDFGIALGGTQAGSSTATLGTAGYAAPEQFRPGGICDARTDVYALGATLCFLLCGSPPSRLEPQSYGRGLPGVSAQLSHVVRKATAAEPRDRYQTCTQMKDELLRAQQTPLRRGGSRGGGGVPTALPGGGHGASAARTKGRARRALGNHGLPWACATWAVRPAMLGLIAVACVTAALGAVLHARMQDQAFSDLLATAETASAISGDSTPSEAERACLEAIATRPQDPRAYQLLIRRVYRADARFSDAEARRWEEVASRNAAQMRRWDDYAQLCVDVGTLYFVYGEDSDELRRGASASVWYEAAYGLLGASEGGAGQTPEAAELACLVTICGIDRDLALGERAGDEGQVYRDYWEALCRAMDDESVPAQLGLRVCLQAVRMLSSPTTAAGLVSAGISRGQMLELLDRVEGVVQRARSDGRTEDERLEREMAEEVESMRDEAKGCVDLAAGADKSQGRAST